MTPRISVLVALAVATMATPATADRPHDRDRGFSFALLGDTPYGVANEPAFDNVVDDINDDRSVKFVIHAGDIKGGGERCDDELLVRRFRQFEELRTPFIYTPGDNEWTDCHRTSNGTYLPTERLAFIRDLFFPRPGRTTGGRAMPVYTQAEFEGFETFVENTGFVRGGVVFSQIHVVGSANNLRPWNQLDPTDTVDTPRADRIAEFTARNAASIDWLERTFKLAAEIDAPGVFVTIHADPNFDNPTADATGFSQFMDKLYELTRAFGKPVVLAHGDSHRFRMDTPRLTPWYYNPDRTSNDEAGNLVVTNLVRVESFGDSNNHWVKIQVDPRSKEVFTFAPQIVEANIR